MAETPLQTVPAALVLPMQDARIGKARASFERVEAWLEGQADRLVLWVPILFGGGIAAWLAVGSQLAWAGLLLTLLGLALAALLLPLGSRLRRAALVAPLLLAAGMGAIWTKSLLVAGPVIERPVVTHFAATVEKVEERTAQGQARLTLRPLRRADLPFRVRVTVRTEDAAGRPIRRPGITAGATISLTARLMPPPGPPVPGAYDFARRAWFDRLGAVGSLIGDIDVVGQRQGPMLAAARAAVGDHVASRVAGPGVGIAVAFVNGDRGRISEAIEETMRDSGLTHLLSISGLHVTAVVGAVMLLVVRMLALWPALAWRWPLWTVGAAAGALAGVGYTLFTGAEVPTIRSCLAAILILAALAMGREALTLRVMAAAAMIILLIWPEALMGASFQLSFAAVAAIVAFHDSHWARRHLSRRDEPGFERVTRALAGLLITGVVIELVLTPIVLFHFHRAGLYGSVANVIGIPLTTFIAMPALALGLLADAPAALSGQLLPPLGAPFWWLVERSLGLLVSLADGVARAPGAVRTMPAAPIYAFAMMVIGGTWALIWTGKVRWLGLLPVSLGLVITWSAKAPVLFVSADGRHVGQRLADGSLALLGGRADGFASDTMVELAGSSDAPRRLADQPGVECNADACRWTIFDGGRSLRILAARGNHPLPPQQLARACAEADLVIMPRWLKSECRPRWRLIDRDWLDDHGGLALRLDPLSIQTGLDRASDHPWRAPPTVTGNDEL